MRSFAINNLNIIARSIVYSLWAWICYYDGFHLTFAMRSLVNFIIIADIVTWVMYQIYLLPRSVINFGIGALVNVFVIIILIKGVKYIMPETADLQAMAAMVFFLIFGVKGMYYFMLEMDSDRSQ